LRESDKHQTRFTRRQLLTISRKGQVRSEISRSGGTQPNLPYADEVGQTPTAHFFNPIGHIAPVIDLERWRLRFGGFVEQPIAVTVDDLKAMPTSRLSATVVNIKSRPDQFMMGHAVWQGVALETLLKSVQVSSEARFASFRSVNGYTTYLSIEQLEGAMLATEMNGETLSMEQGYPVRLIVPGVYDYKLPKWLEYITFTEAQPTGYFEGRGYSSTGDVQTAAMIFSPHQREMVNGLVTFNGMAFGGKRDIQQIELSVDDGEWMPVPFEAAEHGTWTRWQIDWMPPAVGDYLVKVRVSDTTEPTSVFSAFHSVVFRVVR